jgi:hypothetical protein
MEGGVQAARAETATLPLGISLALDQVDATGLDDRRSEQLKLGGNQSRFKRGRCDVDLLRKSDR